MLTSKRHLLISIASLVVLGGVIYLSTQFIDWKNLYFTLIPKAAAIELEKAYKKNFDGAASALASANDEIDLVHTTAKTSSDIENGDTQVRGYFSQRDAYFSEMVRIDNQALRLHLPLAYKTFYAKRLKADTNDYDAFKMYYQGEDGMMDAIIAETKFNDAYSASYDYFLNLYQNDSFNSHTVARFKTMVEQLDAQYKNIAGLADTSNIYSQDLLTYLQHEYDMISLFRQMADAIATNDQAREQAIVDEAVNKEKVKFPDVYSIVTAWGKDKIEPIVIAQDQKHKRSWDLYNEAYLYAKNENLTDILKVWSSSPPGTTETNNKAA